jgi:uncharacterized membrane protein
MNFPEGLFGSELTFGAYVPLVLVWLWAIRTASWRRLADSGQLNVWLGTIVVLMLMWSMKAGVRPGMNLHLLGATVFTLMFGRQLAIIGLSIVLAAVTFNSAGNGIGWAPYALNALVMAMFPVFMAFGVLRLVERFLPANIFVYFFVGAFFNAGLITVTTGLLASLLLGLAGVYTAELLLSDYFPYFILLGFAEAWLNGAAITLMVVYFPHWVGTFDDRRYLWNNKSVEKNHE